MEKEMVIVLDYGGQYNQLIARRVRECNVYCEVKPYNSPIEEIKKLSPKLIVRVLERLLNVHVVGCALLTISQ